MNLLKINLGCGTRPAKGYVNVDINPEVKPDKVFDCSIPLTRVFKAGEAVEIKAIHLLEHLEFGRACAALRSWHKVLRPGGKLIIEMPNIEVLAACFLKFPDQRDVIKEWIFGGQDRDGQYHKWGWTPAELQYELEEIGFLTSIVTQPKDHLNWPDASFRVEAVK